MTVTCPYLKHENISLRHKIILQLTKVLKKKYVNSIEWKEKESCSMVINICL